jgi:hypothetical protein
MKINNKEKGNSMARRDTNAKQQTFSTTTLAAISVMLAGDFPHWQEKAIPMQMQASGYGIGDPIPSDYRTHHRCAVKFPPEVNCIINIEHNKKQKNIEYDNNIEDQ